MLGSRLTRTAQLLALVVALLVLVPSMSLADNLQSDGDGLTPVTDSNLSFGTVCRNVASSKTVILAVNRNGSAGGTNVYKDSSSVTVTGSTASAGLSITDPASSIAIPSNWGAQANNTKSPSVTATVTLTASATGAYSGSITWTGAGVNSADETLSRTDAMSVSATVNNCDTTPPQTTIDSAPAALTSSTSAAFTYSSNESGSTFECKLDAGAFASCPASGKSYSGLGEGSHTFQVRATDAAGNTDASPAQHSWTIDSTPPAVSAPDLTNASDNGTSQSDDITNDATPSFTGTAEDGATVELLRDGSPVGSTTATGGTWSFTSAALSEGTYGFAARASDGAGNSATSPALSVLIDLTDPTITEASRLPAANSYGWNNAAVAVSWNCSDALSGVVAATDSDTISGEGAGQTANGSCSDVAGNSASASRGGINIDMTAPSASASAETNGSPYTAGTWSRYDVVVAFSCSDALSGVASLTDPATLGEGANQSASGTCTDEAGNSAGASFDNVDVDKTAPVASASAKTADDAAYAGGIWSNQDVTVTFDCTDALSGVGSLTPGSSTLNSDGADQSASATCTDNAGNTASASFGDIDIDKTAPTIAFVSRMAAANLAGWNNAPVTVTWSCGDALSGAVSSSVSDTKSGEGVDQTANGTCYDNAGNSASASVSNIDIDLTDPYGIAWTGGPAAGASYYYGSVPAAPTCNAFDDLSGVVSCSVSGYSTAVGSHTMTATAVDAAANDASVTRSYTVLAWTMNGFYQPVDMNGVWNTVKNGSTVPLKWEMFAGSTELTDTSLVSLETKQLSCSGGVGEDAVEMTATGGTLLRYDATGGQFIYNWQTPKKAGTCYRVTMSAADGSTLAALFKLK